MATAPARSSRSTSSSRPAILPVALAVGYGVIDVGLDPHARTSPKKRPIIRPWLLRLVQNAYFPDPASRAEPLASPAFDPDLAGFPPTLVTTGGLNSLEADGRIFAGKLRAAGADVTYRCFPDADHSYTHRPPVETAREAITGLGDHLTRAYAAGRGSAGGGGRRSPRSRTRTEMAMGEPAKPKSSRRRRSRKRR